MASPENNSYGTTAVVPDDHFPSSSTADHKRNVSHPNTYSCISISTFLALSIFFVVYFFNSINDRHHFSRTPLTSITSNNSLLFNHTGSKLESEAYSIKRGGNTILPSSVTGHGFSSRSRSPYPGAITTTIPTDSDLSALPHTLKVHLHHLVRTPETSLNSRKSRHALAQCVRSMCALQRELAQREAAFHRVTKLKLDVLSGFWSGADGVGAGMGMGDVLAAERVLESILLEQEIYVLFVGDVVRAVEEMAGVVQGIVGAVEDGD